MRLRKDPLARETVSQSSLVVADPALKRGLWRNVLKLDPDAVLNLEIGMGRGKFIVQALAMMPDEGWLGLELREEVIAKALSRLEGEEPSNFRILWQNAQLLKDFFEAGEVDNLYLHFSDPWPKARHTKRRLTWKGFLELYAVILAKDGVLNFKTDKQAFFLWSKASFTENGWLILEENLDTPVHPQGLATEYELRFRQFGQPIYALRLKKPD